ncbi:MAG: TerB family tellurite resistance protein [Taibaiella sp.]|nr:TerB family tellurite resistance protein [Taibaiella sp.]
MKSLEDLKQDLLADGKIDAAEVAELEKHLYADGKIDTDEADFLFELNNAVSGNENAPEWEIFFIEAISGYLLDDVNSAGEIDEDEATWLHDKITGDGSIDATERNLLLHLSERSNNFPDHLAELLNSN